MTNYEICCDLLQGKKEDDNLNYFNLFLSRGTKDMQL